MPQPVAGAAAADEGGCGRVKWLRVEKLALIYAAEILGGRKKATRLNLHKRRRLFPPSLPALPAAKVTSLTVAAFIIAPRPHVQGEASEGGRYTYMK